jgi:hypothetical protein
MVDHSTSNVNPFPHNILDRMAAAILARDTADTEPPPPDSTSTPVSLPALDLFNMTTDITPGTE